MSLVTRDTRLYNPLYPNDYPVYLYQLSSKPGNGNTMFPVKIDSAALVDFNYFPVEDVDLPVGDVLIEGLPELVGDVWVRTWTVRDYSPEELATMLQEAKDNALIEIENLRVSEFRAGVPYKFGEDLYHVQVRTEDRVNILARRVMAKEALEDSVPYQVNFRMAENVSVALDATEMVAMADSVAIQVDKAYQDVWDLKDLVQLAEVMADMPEIPSALFVVGTFARP